MNELKKLRNGHFGNLLFVLLSTIGSIVITSGCSRPNGKSSQNIRLNLKMPPHPSIDAKSINRMAAASVPKFCYLINVNGPSVPQTIKQCYPNLGIASEFSEPDGIISIEIPKASNYEFQLYAYLLAEGESCTTLRKLEDLAVNRTFLMGTTSNVDITQDDQTVYLTSHFPGLTKNLFSSMNLGPECGKDQPPELNVTSANANGGIQLGNKYKIDGSIARATGNSITKGQKYSISGEVSYATH